MLHPLQEFWFLLAEMPKIPQYYVLLADMNPSVIWASVMLLAEFSFSNSDVVLTKHYSGIIPAVITSGLHSVSNYWWNNPSVMLCQNCLSNTEGKFSQYCLYKSALLTEISASNVLLTFFMIPFHFLILIKGIKFIKHK